tara:strand:- start:275 stop:466 length:192 start_codon:yes stop_codon:yes gene_type:complete
MGIFDELEAEIAKPKPKVGEGFTRIESLTIKGKPKGKAKPKKKKEKSNKESIKQRAKDAFAQF